MKEHSHHKYTEEQKKIRKGYRVVFLTIFAGALMLEALLFLRMQAREVALILKEDFHIVVVKSEKSDSTSMEERFKALPGTAEINFVSKAQRLKDLRDEDPDLVGVVANMGANPMPDTFEITVDESALGSLSSWVEAAWKIEGVTDIKYKPLEAYSILHALFYENYILVVISMAFLALTAMTLMTVLYRNTPTNLLESVMRDKNWFFAGLAASLLAAIVSYALVYPVKYLSPLWLWPGVIWQTAVVIFGGISAWVIFQWKSTN